MKKPTNKCRCGSIVFEDIDVTPIGIRKKRYFTRCKQCGLVIMAYRCAARGVFHRGLSMLKKICS